DIFPRLKFRRLLFRSRPPYGMCFHPAMTKLIPAPSPHRLAALAAAWRLVRSGADPATIHDPEVRRFAELLARSRRGDVPLLRVQIDRASCRERVDKCC